MTAYRVKPGRKYFYQGKEYQSNEVVELQPGDMKFVKVLTLPRGPLEELNARKSHADLPKAAYETRKMEPEQAPLAQEPEKSPAPENPEANSPPSETENQSAPRGRRSYNRRDMKPEQ